MSVPPHATICSRCDGRGWYVAERLTLDAEMISRVRELLAPLIAGAIVPRSNEPADIVAARIAEKLTCP